MLIDKCSHPQFAVQSTDKRYPLLYGSSATEECTLCASFRLVRGCKDDWQAGPIDKKIAEAEKQLDELA